MNKKIKKEILDLSLSTRFDDMPQELWDAMDEPFIEEHVFGAQDRERNVRFTVLKKKILSEEFIERHYDMTRMAESQEIMYNQNVSQEFVEGYLPYFGEDELSTMSNSVTLDEDFMRRHADKLDWEAVSTMQEFSEEFFWEFCERMDLEDISQNENLKWFAKGKRSQKLELYMRMNESN